ncbi:MAG TPA: hypothetical protein VFA95_11735 [Gammaproteobacteria bacterium]|nr:hypothetical protein [Gammaproteobacteria bacterium]
MMTADEFRRWRLSLKPLGRRRRVSQQEAARLLGVAKSTYALYESRGSRSRVVALACSAVKLGLPPYDNVYR